MSQHIGRILGVAGAVVLIGGAIAIGANRLADDGDESSRVLPSDRSVAAAEDSRRADGAVVKDFSLVAAPATVDLGGETVQTWAFNGTVPGPEIRVQAGDVVRARVENDLPDPLTIHWHGIALRNDMDGVPGLTQAAIQPGQTFTYEFTTPDPGTYFYHPHTGTQLDRGLYAPLIVEDPAESARYGGDVTLMLDDWIDGTGQTPDDVFDDLRSGSAAAMGGMDMSSMDMNMTGVGDSATSGMDDMAGMDMGGDSAGAMTADPDAPLGSDTGDVLYPMYLINGRTGAAPQEVAVGPGDEVRLRLINAGSDTPFRVAVGGSRLRVIASDGFPIEPVTVDTILLGMGERYDVVVIGPESGAVPIVAVPEGKPASALAVLRAGPGPAPAAGVLPPELNGELLKLDDLRATADVALPEQQPDRTYNVTLSGDMSSYQWGISTSAGDGTSLPVGQGDRVRLVIQNPTMMWHPIHLHGHTFEVVTGNGTGPRKDTVIVPAMATVTIEFDADNPGQWVLHCHNIYHAEAGMMTVLSYVA